MAKVKDETHIPFANEDGMENKVYVLWSVDDEEGYGVDIQDHDAGIESFSFGHGTEAYEFSFRVFTWISENLKASLDFFNVLNPLVCCYPDQMRDMDNIRLMVEEWETVDSFFEKLEELHKNNEYDEMMDTMLNVQQFLIANGYLTNDLLPHEEHRGNRNCLAAREVYLRVRGEYQGDADPCRDFSDLSVALEWLKANGVAV